jgi:hypothetical protein
MKYLIKIQYTTGNSYKSYETSDVLELSWSDLTVAKANLKRIQEHYICYRVDKDYKGRDGSYFKYLTPDQKLMYDLRKQQDWCVGNTNKFEYHDAIKLYTDNGNVWQISTFWIGYFETLNEIEIIVDPKEMKISF